MPCLWGNGSEDLVEKRGQGTEKDRKREREAEWEHAGTERERVYEEVGLGYGAVLSEDASPGGGCRRKLLGRA